MTKEELVSVLEAHRVPLHEWGRGEAKTIDHLLEEINSGEASISEEGGGLLRTAVGSVLTICYVDSHRTLKLREDRQVFADGRERKRDLDISISEKMRPGEDSREAALRALREELGISEVLPLTPLPSDVKGPVPSVSFPGLMTKYIRYAYHVYLPTHLYRPEGYVEEQKDKKNYFVWVQIPAEGIS